MGSSLGPIDPSRQYARRRAAPRYLWAQSVLGPASNCKSATLFGAGLGETVVRERASLAIGWLLKSQVAGGPTSTLTCFQLIAESTQRSYRICREPFQELDPAVASARAVWTSSSSRLNGRRK
jgi:hypothetical protein